MTMSEREFQIQLRAAFLQIANARGPDQQRRAWIRLAKVIERRYAKPPID